MKTILNVFCIQMLIQTVGVVKSNFMQREWRKTDKTKLILLEEIIIDKELVFPLRYSINLEYSVLYLNVS